jgi:hypothetical protein
MYVSCSKHTYRRHHDRWWKDIAEHEVWQWRPPSLGRSRHLGLRELITKIEACRQEAFYRELIDSDMVQAFEKINVIDDLIHQNFTPFDELLALATPQLEIACQHRRSRLDPAQPLLIFADHGFRIAQNGLGYTHGGAPTLERVVPLWLFETL